MRSAPPPTENPAAAAADLWQRVHDLVAELDAEDWGRPTPCSGWDVHDLVGHLSGTQTGFDGSAPRPPAPEGWAPPVGAHPRDAWTAEAVAARRDWTPAQVLAELDLARAGHVAHLRSIGDWGAGRDGPVGKTTEAGLFAVRCFDIWVHLQDLREALGLEVETGDASPAAREAYGYVLGLVPWLYAKRVEAPPGSTMRLSLREPYVFDSVLRRGDDGRVVWDERADPGARRVEANPAAFTLLVTGRGSPDRWRTAGLLDWSGARAAEFVSRARMF